MYTSNVTIPFSSQTSSATSGIKKKDRSTARKHCGSRSTEHRPAISGPSGATVSCIGAFHWAGVANKINPQGNHSRPIILAFDVFFDPCMTSTRFRQKHEAHHRQRERRAKPPQLAKSLRLRLEAFMQLPYDVTTWLTRTAYDCPNIAIHVPRLSPPTKGEYTTD